MHELGIVFYIIKDVKNVAEANSVKRVAEVELELGEVSGVVPYLLEDCWKWAVKKEPVMTDAALKIDTVKAVTKCDGCGAEYETVKHGKICPECGSDKTYLVTGNEVSIKQITATD